jgi:serine/threonine protein kinase
MRPELWPRVTDLMHRAIDVPEEVRRTWIETEAGGDAELVAEVVRLLDAHAEAGRFLDDPLIAQAGAIAALRDAIGDRRPQLAIGQHLGPFVLEAPLGAGGMGEVWRARDTALGRTVAIKVLAAEFSGDAERLHRFEQEARAAGLINHPNILTVHAVGSHDGFPYLVTELLEGETLKERLAGGAIPPRKAVDLAVQIARGLGAAHERGIVHRDLKPANLFVTTDGRLKILDFGLAKLRAQQDIERDEAHSVSGTVLGTAGYMAPEQVRGQAVDHRADIFALGVVLYEMLAGRRAFDAPSAVETMHQILTAEPAPLEGIDPAIVRIVEHCLEKNAGERFQAARDLAFHLEAARPTTDSAAPVRGPMPSRGPAAVWLRRSLPWLLAASAVAFAVWLRTGDPARAPLSEAPLRRFAVSLAGASPTSPKAATARKSWFVISMRSRPGPLREGVMRSDPSSRPTASTWVSSRATVSCGFPSRAESLPASPPPRPSRVAVSGAMTATSTSRLRNRPASFESLPTAESPSL